MKTYNYNGLELVESGEVRQPIRGEVYLDGCPVTAHQVPCGIHPILITKGKAMNSITIDNVTIELTPEQVEKFRKDMKSEVKVGDWVKLEHKEHGVYDFRKVCKIDKDMIWFTCGTWLSRDGVEKLSHELCAMLENELAK